MRKFKIVALLVAVLVTLSFGTMASAKSQLVIGVDPDWMTFDPARAYESYSAMVFDVIYDNLVKFEGLDVTVSPCIATSWQMSADGKTFTFKLRDDVSFTSGNKLTSKDVKWSLDRLTRLGGNPSFLVETIVGIDAPDDYTIVIRLSAPEVALLPKLATMPFGILDSEVVKKHGGRAGKDASKTDKAEEWLNNNSAGSGPYILKRFEINEIVVLEKNPNYWRDVPGADKIVLRAMKDQNTQMMTVQRGEIDIAWELNEELVKQLKGKKDVKVLQTFTQTLSFMLMNMDPEVGGPVANPTVQRAIRHAVDYRGIQAIAGSGAITPQSIIQKGYMGALPPRNPDFTDRQKARELLKEAGYPNGFDTVLNVPLYKEEGVSTGTMAEKIAADLNAVGIRAKIRTMENLVGLEEYRNGEWELGIQGWGPDYPDALNQLAFLPGNYVGLRANWTKEMNPQLHEMGKMAMAELDDKKREQLLIKIQEIMAADSPWLVYCQYANQIAVRANIENVYYHQAAMLELDQIVKK